MVPVLVTGLTGRSENRTNTKRLCLHRLVETQRFDCILQIRRRQCVRANRQNPVSRQFSGSGQCPGFETPPRHPPDVCLFGIVLRSGAPRRSGDGNIRVHKSGHHHLARGVNLSGVTGGNKIFHPSRGPHFLDNSVTDEDGSIWDNIEVCHAGPSTGPACAAQRQQLPGTTDQRPLGVFEGARRRIRSRLIHSRNVSDIVSVIRPNRGVNGN